MKLHAKTIIPLVLISIILLLTNISQPSSAQTPELKDPQSVSSTGENIPANFTATQTTQWINNKTNYYRAEDISKNDAFYKTLNLTTSFDNIKFNTTKITLNFTNIQPQNLTKEIEIEGKSSPDEGTFFINGTPAAMSFQIPNQTCYLTSFQVRIKVKTTPATPHNVTINWKVMNARNESFVTKSYPYPNADLTFGSLNISVSGTEFFSLDIPVVPSLLLNESETFNRTFFIWLNVSNINVNENEYAIWLAYSDLSLTLGDGINEGYAYYEEPFGPPKDYDFFLQYVTLAPLKDNYTPKDYNLRVNGTLVGSNGIWENDVFVSTDTVALKVSADWLLKFNVTCESFHVRDGTLATEFYVHADFDNSTWYVKSNFTYPSELNNASTKFYVPSDWQLVNTTNVGMVGNLVTVNSSSLWTLIFNGTNYINSIVHPANVSVGEAITFNANLADVVTNGNLTLAIYNGSKLKIYEDRKTVDEGTAFAWTPTKEIKKGNYSVTILFYNGTEVGYRISVFKVLHTIEIVVDTLEPYYFVEDNIRIRVQCNNTVINETVSDATIYANWTKGIVNFTYNSTSGWYEGYFNTSGLLAKQYNITIYVEGDYYEKTNITITMNLVYRTQVAVSPDINITGEYNTPVTIVVYYTYVNGSLIKDANVTGYVDNTKYDFTYNGTAYSITMTFQELGTFTMTINCSKPRHQPQTKNITITINPLLTTLKITVNGENITFYAVEYPSPVNFSLIFQDKNGNPVVNAETRECILEMINGSIKTLTLIDEGNGLYTLSLSLDEFNPYPEPKSLIGNHILTFRLLKYGYEERRVNITINITPGETRVEIVCPESVEAGSLFTIFANYTDKEGKTLSYLNGTIYLNDTIIMIFNETQISLNLTQYIGTYNISIIVTHPNYKPQTWKGTITIYGKIKATYSPGVLEEYENETITIQFYIEDLYRKTPIENYNLTIKLNTYEWFMKWNSQNPSFTLNLTGVEPGNYSITVLIEAPNYVPTTFEIPLHILPKTRVILTVNIPQEVTAGDTIPISGTLTTESGEPIAMATIKIIIQVTYENGTTKEYTYETVTNMRGEFSYTFQTTKKMTKINIMITYGGTREKASTTSRYSITVKPLTIFATLLHAWWIFALLATTFAVFAETRRRISKRKKKTEVERGKLLREYELILEFNSLESLLVVSKESGLCIFEYPFKGSSINSNLVAGFVQAIRGFYVEIGGAREGEVGEIYYEMPEPKVLTFHSGRYTYAILIAPGKLLPEVKECLRNFLDRFEEEFKEPLEKDITNTSIYSRAKEFIKECFPQQIFAEYKVPEKLPKTRGIKKKILKIAKELTENKGSFNIAELLTEVARKEKIDPLKALKTLKELINQNLIQSAQQKLENDSHSNFE